MNGTSDIWYRVISKLKFSGEPTIFYRVIDIRNGQTYTVSHKELYSAAVAGRVENLSAKNGRFRGINGFQFSKLGIITVNKISNSTKTLFSSIVYALNDDNMKEYKLQYSSFKPRVQLKSILAHLNTVDTNICTLYGLRRTGKTVLLYQAMAAMNFKSCLFATLSDTSTYEDLKGLLDYCLNAGIKYVFLDEITAMPTLLDFIAILPNFYAARGLRIVVTGTDSYMLWLAEHSTIFDKCVRISTTPILYSECVFLLGSMTVEDYIQHYGGVLKKDIFYDSQRAHAYVDTAISDNIYRSVSRLQDFAADETVDFVQLTAFKQIMAHIIEKKDALLTASKLVSEFKSSDFGELRGCAPEYFNIDKTFLEKGKISDLEAIRNNIADQLAISRFIAKTDPLYDAIIQHRDTAYTLLTRIGVLVPIKHAIKGTIRMEYLQQLPGLHYAHTCAVCAALSYDANFNKFTATEKKDFISRLESCAFGGILEHVILRHLMQLYGFDSVYYYNSDTAEFDGVVQFGNSAYILEFKWSTGAYETHAKHISNKDSCSEFKAYMGVNKIVGKYVIYRGRTLQVNSSNVWYINVEDFLLHTNKYINIK